MHRSLAGAFDCIEWSLPRQHMILRAEVTSSSLCGPHHFGRVWGRGVSDATWRQIELVSALHILIHECYRQVDEAQADTLRGFELELLMRVLESYQQTALYVERAGAGSAGSDHFIEAEQSLVFGHWQHPTPKSRQGMTYWQQESYAPELRGQFKLHYFAANATHIRQASARDVDAHAIVRSLVGADLDAIALRGNEQLLPMHPLQAEALLLAPEIEALIGQGALRHIGPLGPTFTATSSVRTVYAADADWMLKFSLPVRITNSVRLNRRQELEAGVAMAKLIDRIGLVERSSNFRIIQDPAYITLDLPGRSESGFEVILRENPFARGTGRGVVTVAALTADPLPGQPSRLKRLVQLVATRDGGSLNQAAIAWLRHYLDCAVEPLIRLYDDFGIALEAHQQNSLLDVDNGYPSISYYRDNQGFYLSERYRSRLVGYVPETQTIASLYFPDSEIRDRFAYYLIVNQVFSVISRMGHDGLCEESVLLRELRVHLERYTTQMTGAGRDFARHVLDLPTIVSKANLTTRLYDVDELQSNHAPTLYRPVPNPLRAPTVLTLPRTDHAIAS
ncbi:IucA/IucC family protein [Ensifer sp.]|uniref:IucA/IucC family protein n=1 Tax=Ensifer sp. TaxID=1872086 RepID=UPI002E0E06A7|nr:IucA/IucC family protein [Ensifer sp.]